MTAPRRFGSARGSDRLGAIVAVVAIHAALAYFLIVGLRVRFAIPTETIAHLVDFSVPPPPPEIIVPPPPKPRERSRPAAARALPDPKGGATGPSPVKALAAQAAPSLVTTAPAAGGIAGSGTSLGTGSGGGTGGSGDGDGNGTGGSELEQIAGEIRDSDYPRGPLKAGIGGVVEFRFTVAATGRVSACGITRSSGNGELDATTCRIVMQRFRYRPATDRQGRAIAEEVDGDHRWSVEHRIDTDQ